MNLFSIIYSAMCLSSKVTNIEYPVCKTCIHFLPYYQNPQLPENYYAYTYAKCKLFGNKNVVTGEIVYEYADMCRINTIKCNMTGNYHEMAK